MVRLSGILKEALATLGNPPIHMQQVRSVRGLVSTMSRCSLQRCATCWAAQHSSGCSWDSQTCGAAE